MTAADRDREAFEAWARDLGISTGTDDQGRYANPTLNHGLAAYLKGRADEAHARAQAGEPVAPFQARVDPWMQACFGPIISADRLERGDRLLEEVLELLQSGGYPAERVAALTGYVWSRPAGKPTQEVGGVMVTLAAYCLAHGLDMHESGETELARIWTKVDKIRAKQAAKPTGSALPMAWPQSATAQEPVAVPAGFVMVPLKPTHEMVDVGEKARWQSAVRDANNVREIYAAMLAAAPKQRPHHGDR
ncbi:hypothetical protein [Xanthobacter dioxanivorans]|uniref:hypothetical protein n=1 Tax=Xanthobacter dioxanivorans TaxID=2528964 RepID=UPI001E5505F8|nr:hypothetical protein [Xanthobacter dioxanivorans]